MEAYLKQSNLKLTKKVATPLTAEYRLELDVSEELGTTDAVYYQSLIGVLRQIVQMGHVDMCCKVLIMSLFVAMPREGQLQQLYYIFAYLKIYYNTRIVFNPTYPEIDYMKFDRQSQEKFYENVKDELPLYMLEPL